MTGKIKALRGGYGFITPDEGDKDVFFHASSLDGATFDSLKEGQAVTFDAVQGEKGPKAEHVKIAQASQEVTS